MKKNYKQYAIYMLLCIGTVYLLSSCLGTPAKNKKPFLQEGSKTWGAVGNVFNLGQGWNQKVQEYWWFTSQGTQIIPYDWFLHLEQASNQKLFRSNQNLKRLRTLIQTPTKLNPDGLPVGFVKDKDHKTGDWFGVNCSACHTSQIDFKGKSIRVDGGPSMMNFNALVFTGILPAMQATLADDAKFARFASKVLGPNPTTAKSDALRKKVRSRANFLQRRARTSAAPDSLAGYARLDAVNNIFNAVFGLDLISATDTSELSPPNIHPGLAPVNFPAVWDAPHTDLVQWSGFVNNKPPGPVARNLGEVLGVFATFEYKHKEGKVGYESSVRIKKQGWMEEWMTELWSPKWPASILGKIDGEKATRGDSLYKENCISCHVVMKDTRAPKREIRAQMFPIEEIGTDSLNAISFANRAAGMVKTGKIEGRKKDYIIGKPFGPEAKGVEVIVHAEAGILENEAGSALASVVRSTFTPVDKAKKFNPKSYRARPLNGVWATAPYLHNGSVPNLFALLQKAEDRPKKFLVGNREYDPEKVGYETTMPADGRATLLNTALPGNRNTGHEFGHDLTHEQRMALIEYIKTL